LLINNIRLNKTIEIVSYFILNIYIIKNFLISIPDFILILFINNIRAIEGNNFNKNGIPNLVIEEKEEKKKKKKKEKPKKEKEENKNIPEKILLKNKIVKIKRLIIIISIYIYYNILIFGPSNIIKV